MFFLKSRNGFTLIELLIVIAVLGVVASSVFISYRSLVRNADLKTTSFKIIDALQVARARTIASDASTQYGVHLELDKYVFFEGATYNILNPNNVIYTVPTGIEIVSISLAGGSFDVLFDRITGNTSQNGSLKVQTTDIPASFHIISILSSGRTDVMGDITLPPGGTRISDTRHVHFTYAQDVNSAVTLTLGFPGYPSQNIDFQANLSGGIFNWSGTVNVGGVDQVMQIRTHSLTVFAAEFSVTRDLRYNDKELIISLDGQNILNYAVSGIASKGSSVWASVPVIQ